MVAVRKLWRSGVIPGRAAQGRQSPGCATLTCCASSARGHHEQHSPPTSPHIKCLDWTRKVTCRTARMHFSDIHFPRTVWGNISISLNTLALLVFTKISHGEVLQK